MQTHTKSSVLARLRQFDRHVQCNHDLIFNTANLPAKSLKSKLHEKMLKEQAGQLKQQLAKLMSEMEAQIKEECTPAYNFCGESFKVALDNTRKKFMKQYANFPIAAALVEALFLALEAEMNFCATIWSLRNAAGAEDRTHPSHQSFYHINGEVNDIGNRVGKPPE